MMIRAAGLFIIFSLAFLQAVFSQDARDKAIQETFDKLKTPSVEAEIEIPSRAESSAKLFSQRADIINKTLDEIEIDIGLKIGYMAGSTTYDWLDGLSELRFPFDCFAGGGSVKLGFKNLSLNAEAWAPIQEESNSHNWDKDWISGVLVSYTESKEEIDGYILDANLRYDFYNRALPRNIGLLLLSAGDGLKIGALLGYRYTRFDFNLFDLYNMIAGGTSNAGEKIGTYKIEYYLPYIGIAVDVLRKTFKFNLSLKYCINPTAEDLDNHLLRKLTFPSEYDRPKYGFLVAAEGGWNFAKNWNLSLGVDASFVNIHGHSWTEGGGPSSYGGITTDLKQAIFWSGINYSF